MSPEIIHHPLPYIACFVLGLVIGAIVLPCSIWISDRWNRES